MRGGPFEDESQCPARQAAAINCEGLDLDQRLVLAVLGVKVGGR